jgi:hypothetical protein
MVDSQTRALENTKARVCTRENTRHKAGLASQIGQKWVRNYPAIGLCETTLTPAIGLCETTYSLLQSVKRSSKSRIQRIMSSKAARPHQPANSCSKLGYLTVGYIYGQRRAHL